MCLIQKFRAIKLILEWRRFGSTAAKTHSVNNFLAGLGMAAEEGNKREWDLIIEDLVPIVGPWIRNPPELR